MAGLKITPHGHGFALSGELDMASAADFARALGHATGVGAPLTVDMQQLKFMDSSAIQAIIAAAKVASEICIVLHGVHNEVQEVVDMTGIESAMPNLHVIPCTIGVPSAAG